MAYDAVPTVVAGDFGLASWANKVAGNDAFWATAIDTTTAKVITDGVVEGSITASAVSSGKLKLSLLSTTLACGATVTRAALGSAYCHIPNWAWTPSFSGTCAVLMAGTGGTVAYPSALASGYYIASNGGGASPNPTVASYAVYYHAACPPHDPFGVGEWGDFLFVMRLKSSGLELGAWLAESPPWNMDSKRWEKDDPEALDGFTPPLWIDEAGLADEVDSGGFAPELGVSAGDRPEIVMVDTREICMVETAFCPARERALIATAKAAEITDDVIRDAPEGSRRQYLLDKRDRLIAKAERPAALEAEVTAAETSFMEAAAISEECEGLARDSRKRALGFGKSRAGPARLARSQFLAALKLAAEAHRATNAARAALAIAQTAADPVPMKARDALVLRAQLRGMTPWDLLKAEHPEVMSATTESMENGRSIRSGVPDFDEKMVILRP